VSRISHMIMTTRTTHWDITYIINSQYAQEVAV